VTASAFRFTVNARTPDTYTARLRATDQPIGLVRKGVGHWTARELIAEELYAAADALERQAEHPDEGPDAGLADAAQALLVDEFGPEIDDPRDEPTPLDAREILDRA
jgi:hypothetical protein